MKYILLLVTALTSNLHRYPDNLTIICPTSNEQNCFSFHLNNQLNLFVKSASSTIVKNKKQVGIFYVINNKSDDTATFYRGDFTLQSGNIDFVSIPYGIMDDNKFKLKLFSDSLKIPPHSSFQDYVLAYKATKTMTEKEYKNSLRNDTLALFYKNKELLFKLTGKED